MDTTWVKKSEDVLVFFQAMALMDEKISLFRRAESKVLDVCDRHPPCREWMIKHFLEKMERFRCDAQRGLKDMEHTTRQLERISTAATLGFNRSLVGVEKPHGSSCTSVIESPEDIRICVICLNHHALMEEAVSKCAAAEIKVLESWGALEKVKEAVDCWVVSRICSGSHRFA